MAFFDRVAKEVSEAADKAGKAIAEGWDKVKDEVDRRTRISRIRGQMRDQQKQIAALEAQIQAVKVELGERAMDMLQAGTLKDTELQAFSDKVDELEKQIAGHRETIAEMEAAIEAIRAEAEEEEEEVKEEEAEVAEEAEAPAAAPVCAECGGALPEGAAFCPQCGAKVA